MKLYHYTLNRNIKSIFDKGLKPNKLGIVYLCPNYDEVSKIIASSKYDTILEVETGDLKLTSFEDCRDWEVLCWTDKPIPPSRLKLVRDRESKEQHH